MPCSCGIVQVCTWQVLQEQPATCQAVHSTRAVCILSVSRKSGYSTPAPRCCNLPATFFIGAAATTNTRDSASQAYKGTTHMLAHTACRTLCTPLCSLVCVKIIMVRRQLLHQPWCASSHRDTCTCSCDSGFHVACTSTTCAAYGSWASRAWHGQHHTHLCQTRSARVTA